MTVLNHSPKNMSARPVSQAAADAEPADDRLFTEPTLAAPAYPAIELCATITYEGFTFDVTFRDTSIAAATEVLKRRGCQPAGAHQPSAPATNGATPTCPTHGKPMKLMTRPDRAGHTHWCTSKTDDGFCQERA